MNREKAKELQPIVKEWIGGGQLQYLGATGEWWDTDYLKEDLPYRIKPEPREWWIDPFALEVYERTALEVYERINPPHRYAIKVREVL